MTIRDTEINYYTWKFINNKRYLFVYKLVSNNSWTFIEARYNNNILSFQDVSELL